MRSTKLNSLVVEYRETGDLESFSGIYQALSPWCEQASFEVSEFVNDVTSFEARLSVKLEKAIHEYDTNSKLSFRSFAIRIINREKKFYINRNASKPQRVSIEHLNDQFAEQGGFHLQCEAPPVESHVIVNEEVTLLAQGDERKAIILRQWADGENDTEISKVLAHQLGGKATSHYRYIVRFRETLRKNKPSILV